MTETAALLVNQALHDKRCETQTWTASSAFCGCALRRELAKVTRERDRAFDWIGDECKITSPTEEVATKRIVMIMELICRQGD